MSESLRELAQRREVVFGTSGVRGLVANMTDDVCRAYVRAFLQTVARTADLVAVGYDLRPSSPHIAGACIQAIERYGARAVFAGPIATPALAHYCAREGIPGIVVTGSHIPFDRNGIKFFRADGEISKADEQSILDAFVDVDDAAPCSVMPPLDTAPRDAYIARYADFFGDRALNGLRVALYEHSSVARDVLRSILERLGAQVISLGRTDTFVPIDTEAVRPEDVEQARRWAREHSFDAILSTDGDADRPLIGDEHGAWMRGDVVGVLCARYLNATVVVTPVSSNTAVEQCGWFERVVRTRIGSPFVIAGMQSARESLPGDVIVGYEANGGFLLGTSVVKAGRTLAALPTRDAVLPMLALLAAAKSSGCALSTLTRDLPGRFTASDRLQAIPARASGRLLASLAADAVRACALMAPDAGAPSAQDMTDGLRVTFESGDVVHLRASGNAPELRCYAEASSEARARHLCEACLVRAAAALRG